MAKNTGKERLTEMITFVVPPSMRAHLDHAAERMGNAPYAFPAREAIRRYLEEIDPLTPEQLAAITRTYLNNKEAGQ
jgi:predicted DNA-binding protein